MDKQIENVNPQSLCDLINEVVQKRFAGNISEAAATFDKARNKKRMQFEFSRNALTQIIENKQKITYLHLEMIADYLQIPAGVFLLFSRIRADKRDETAIEAIEARTDILALQELLKWISAEEVPIGKKKN